MPRVLKRLTEFKAAPDGSVEAVIATLNVKDHDGDVTLPGFFGQQPAVIVGSHDWSDIMLGKGVVSETDGHAVFTGQFNLNDPDAKAVHAKLMYDLDNPPPLIEWSYGFEVLPGGRKSGQHAGESVSFLGPLDDGSPGSKVWEVSPVLAGAGVGTTTLVAKGRTLSEKIDLLLDDLTATTEGIDDLTAKLDTEGGELTDAKLAMLTRFGDGLTTALASVTKALEEADKDGEGDDDDAAGGGDDDAEKVGDLDLLQAQFSQYAGVTADA